GDIGEERDRHTCRGTLRRGKGAAGSEARASPKPRGFTTGKERCHGRVVNAVMSYKETLQRADAFFAEVMREQPAQLQCGRGCSLCCYGLFEIGSGDVPVIAEGLAQLHPMRRQKIIRRAVEIVATTEHV